MIKIQRNMGNVDRAIRGVVGLTLLILGPVTDVITADRLSGILMGIVGSLALVSAVFSYCILYEVTGLGVTRNKE